MKKIFNALFIALFVLSLNISFVLANEEETFAAAEEIIKQKTFCDVLTEDQLEIIGDYFMEQMHPGESHVLMDNMMGGEGSKSLKQVHINIAKRLYCNENVYIGYGMMGSGGMMNMMGRGMMGNYYPASYNYSNYGYWNIFWILLLAVVIFLIVWIIYRFGIKNISSETPLNILRKRFAKGEITKKEFENMKKDMGV